MSIAADYVPEGGWGPASSVDRVWNAAEKADLKPRGKRTDFMIVCPAHGDINASLHVTYDGKAGRTMLYCHGCQAEARDLAGALGLTMMDLYDTAPPERYDDTTWRASRSRSRQPRTTVRRGPLPKRVTLSKDKKPKGEGEWHEVAVYAYTDAEGTIVQEVVRKERSAGSDREKTFVQRFYTADGAMVTSKPESFTPVLYNLPDVIQAVIEEKTIWLLEGEKDCATATELGLVATTNTGGAKALTPEFLEPLVGVNLNVVVDLDAAGWDRAVRVLEILEGCPVRIFRPATDAKSSDLTDHIEAGYTLEDLIEIEPADVPSHLAAAKVQDYYQRLISAADEITGRLTLERTDKAGADEHRQAALRWLPEIESLLAHMADEIDLIRQAATTNVSVTLAALLEASDQTYHLAIDRARSSFDSLGEARPTILRRPRTATQATSQVTSIDPFDRVINPDIAAMPLVKRNIFDLTTGGIIMRTLSVKNVDDVPRLVPSAEELILDLEAIIERIIIDEPTTNADSLAQNTSSSSSPAPLAAVTAYEIAWRDRDGNIKRATVSAEDLQRSNWVVNIPEITTYDSRPSGKARIFDALRYVSRDVQTTAVRYTGTGWRQLDDSQWAYSHAGGLLTAHGHQDSPTSWGNVLDNYDLAAPFETAEDLRAAFYAASGGAFMAKLPPRVASILIGTTFKAAIDRNPYTTLLVGSPGTFKTGVAALTMHHYGINWDRTRPGTSLTKEGATTNALRMLLNRCRDALFFLDDLNPGGDIAAALRRLGDVLHLIFNQTTRDRMGRDSTLRDGEKPFATGLATSELLPTAGSSAERSLAVPLRRNEISLDAVIDLDAPLKRLARNRLMSSYLQWLAADYETHQADIRRWTGVAAARFRDNHGLAPRDAEPLAHIWAGWSMLLTFLKVKGALSDLEYAQWSGAVGAALLEAGAQAHDADTPTTTSDRVKELLTYSLSSGAAHVTDIKTGDCPTSTDGRDIASLLGWKRPTIRPSAFNPTPGTSVPLEPRGDHLGYVNVETDELLLDTVALEAVLKRVGAGMADPFTIDRGTASRALADIGILKSTVCKGTRRYSLPRRIPCLAGAQRRMFVLDMTALFHNEDEDEPDTQALTGRGPVIPTVDGIEPPAAPEPPAPTPLPLSAPANNLEEPAQPAPQPHQDTSETQQDEKRGAVQTKPTTKSDPAKRATTAAAGEFQFPLVVVDTDTIYLPNGASRPLDRPITGYTDLRDLAIDLHLGTRTSRSRTEGGIVIVTNDLATSLGLPVDDMPADDHSRRKLFEERMQEWADTPHPVLAGATEDGWNVTNTKGVPQVHGTTRMWTDKTQGYQITLEALLSDAIRSQNLTPALLAEAMGKFSAATGRPWHMSPSTTGFDLMIDSRRDRLTVFRSDREIPAPAHLRWIDTDLAWTRKPTPEETRQQYIHVYDRGGAYLSGVSSCVMPQTGDPIHLEDDIIFDPKKAGYWLIDNPTLSDEGTDDWRFPSPLWTPGKRERIWVTTPTLEIARDLDQLPDTIHKAWVWEDSGRLLDNWAKVLRDSRNALIKDPSESGQTALAMLKEVYTKTIGMMGSEEYGQGKRTYAPDRRHHVIARARANLLRSIVKIGNESGRWPVAILSDSVAYTSDEADPVADWPGDRRKYGRGIGSFRAEYTGALGPHLKYLTGAPWKATAKTTLDKVES
ncbi:MAG: hypothetical protein Q4D96_09990 [Propionibacteriaceae bacterium]|nr:hypothetical protein [Propionibacteriaceae bacterium]